MATCFSAWVLFLVMLRGSTSFDKFQLSAWQIIATYYAVGLAGGVITGLFWPLSRTLCGAVILGSLVGTVVYIGVGIGMHGAVSWQSVEDGMILGVPIGGVVGYRLKKVP